MEKKWTDEQRAVIDSSGRNLLVSAAAGAGKTAVLVARIIKKITDKDNPVDIDRLVIITFTKAAAAQMKQKISDELEKLIEAEPENELYRRQVRLLGNAAISTIDSFCLNIVRAYFQKLELDPAFRIADDAELGLIRSDCMDEIMERFYENADEDFYAFVEAYCGYKSDEKLSQYIFSLARKAEAQPWPIEWLKNQVKDYEIEKPEEFDSTKAARIVADHIRKMLLGMLGKVAEAKNLCSTNEGAPEYLPTILEDEKLLTNVLSAKTYSDLGSKLRSMEFGALSRKKTGDKEIKEEVQGIRKTYKDEIKSILKDFYFAKAEEIIGLLKKSLPAVRLLVKMTIEYLELFALKKREKNLIDFSDAEHFALDILWGETPECLEIRKQYSEIIIDEYQDSNNVQEYIVNSMAGKCDEAPFIFTVGDVKQSIYKFRNACPELFVSKQKLYREKKDNGELIILSRNFRSREEVLKSTNAVFRHIMRESIGGIDYDEKAFLQRGTDRQILQGEESPFRTEVLLISDKLVESCEESRKESYKESCEENCIENGEESGNQAENLKGTDKNPQAGEEDIEDEESEEEIEEKKALEARLVASRIKKLIYKEEMEIPDEENEGKTRKIGFGDIVILLRTMKDWSSVFMDVLEAEDIPVFSDELDGFFKSGEITLVIDFLKILDNPRQDIPFVAVLYSCIGKMSEDELAEIRINSCGQKTFYDAALFTMMKYPEEKSGEYPEYVRKLKNFFGLYKKLESIKLTSSVSEIINKIYGLTGLYHYYSAMPDGEKRKANLDMLPGYAVKFEGTGYSGLFGFIRYYEKLKSHELDYGDAGSKLAGNSVQIMSIHKSKGLEFPVVFVAGLGKQFNKDDFKGDVFVSSDNGIGIKYVDLEKRIKYPSFYHSVIKMRGTEDIIGEEMRLLYVAMTRAKDKLIMTGYTDKPNTGTDYAALFKAKSYIDFVFPVLETEKAFFDLKTYSPDTVMKIRYDKSSFADTAGEVSKTIDETFGQKHNSCTCVAEDAGKYVAGEGIKDEKSDISAKRSRLLSDDLERKRNSRSLEDEIAKIRNQVYKYEDENSMPVKLSVSDLKHQMIEEEFGENVFEETREFQPGDKTLPDFMKKDSAETLGTDYGTLVHKCMQFMPMTIKTDREVEAFLDEMVDRQKLTVEERSRMPVCKFVRFLNSEVADRIRSADADKRFYREKQFMILVKAEDIDSEKYGGSDVRIPVQGVIDAMFIENGRIVILDYKTDRLNPGEEERLVKLYQRQLDIYGEAAGKLLGLPVGEKLLYSFSLEKTIPV